MASIKSDKLWADAVRKAVHDYHEAEDETGKVKKIRYLNLLAETLVKAGAKGDMQAMKEIGDRLDGKPSQSIEQKGTIEYHYVAQMPEHQDNPEEWQQQYKPKTIQ